jgi:hypothetical protein
MKPEEYCRRYYRMLRQRQERWQQPELIFKTKEEESSTDVPTISGSNRKQPLKLLRSVMEEINGFKKLCCGCNRRETTG